MQKYKNNVSAGLILQLLHFSAQCIKNINFIPQ